jgi:LysR family hydrogen peroxide-inducible transcriptional activator
MRLILLSHLSIPNQKFGTNSLLPQSVLFVIFTRIFQKAYQTMISIKQLKYALAVGRNLHFRKAAEECNISQSALSTALQEMEQQLGFAVFERNNKNVLITPLGAELLKKAQSINIQIEDIVKMKQTYGQPLSGPLSLGIIPTIAPYLLPMLLPPLNDKYPKLELKIAEEQSQTLVEHVRTGDLDCGILALPFDCQGLLSFSFWDEDFYWVSHKDLAPPASQPTINAQSLESKNLMLLSEGHCLKDHALAACKLHSNAAHSLRATSLTTLIQLVRGKLGSTLVPEIGLSQLVDQSNELVKLPLSEPGPHRKLAFIIRPNYPNLSNIESLINVAKQSLEKSLRQK